MKPGTPRPTPFLSLWATPPEGTTRSSYVPLFSSPGPFSGPFVSVLPAREEAVTVRPTLQLFHEIEDPVKKTMKFSYPWKEIIYNNNLNPVQVVRNKPILNEGAVHRKRLELQMGRFPEYDYRNDSGRPKKYGFSHAPMKHALETYVENIGADSPYYFHVSPEKMKEAERAARANMEKRRANRFRKTYKTNQTTRAKKSPGQRQRNMTQRLRGAYGNEAGQALADLLSEKLKKNRRSK